MHKLEKFNKKFKSNQHDTGRSIIVCGRFPQNYKINKKNWLAQLFKNSQGNFSHVMNIYVHRQMEL